MTKETTKADFIIGRKYISPDKTKTISAFGELISIQSKNINKNNKHKKVFDENVEYQKILNELFKQTTTTTLSELFSKSYSLDIEYVNDILETFTYFPESEDHSHVFMIGILDNTKDDAFVYALHKIDKTLEYNLLLKFLTDIKSNKYIIHWSPADRVYLEKAINRYPELIEIYKQKNLMYIDLMKIFKMNSTLNSYSLKYISNKLLNYKYVSNCRNGYDALLESVTNYTQVKNDIILYNKQDTELLKKITMNLQYRSS